LRSAFGFVVGLFLLLAFCVTTKVIVGVAGFVVMFVSLHAVWTKARRMHQAR